MLGAIALLIGLLGTSFMVIVVVTSEESKQNESYIKGYNDCLLDIDEIIADWKDKDIQSVGLETLRNRIAMEWQGK